MNKERLFETYLGVTHPQALRELASISLESRNIPDSYHLYVHGEKVISSISGQPVEEAMTRISHIDEVEFNAFLNIQEWATKNEQGLGFWLSPPHVERSSQAKIIISELENKKLTNRAILFDVYQEMDCVNIANNLQQIFTPWQIAYLDNEEIRRNPLLTNHKYDVEEWLPVVENLIAAQNQWDMVRTGNDFHEVERATKWAADFALGAVDTAGYVGSNDLSCPITSPFAVVQRNSHEGRFVKKCGNCGVEIEKVIFRGYTCSSCGGEYRGC